MQPRCGNASKAADFIVMALLPLLLSAIAVMARAASRAQETPSSPGLTRR
jgi:hypothetical protein